MNEVSSPDVRPPQAGEPLTIEYVSRPGLLRISIVNFLLTIVTLTIYRFWARTRVRRHIWSCVRINGEPLEYTGTGKELFLGALVVYALIGLPVILAYTVLTLMFGPKHWSLFAMQGVVIFVFMLLYGMAIYRARRYRLSRTLWRGIRGTLVGSPWAYSIRSFGALLLKMVTLGWATPAMNLMLESRITNEMQFGSERFRFAGSAAPLYRTFALCWFLTVFVLLLGGAAFWVVVASHGGWEQFVQSLGKPGGPPSPETIALLVIGAFVALTVYGLVSAILWASYMVRQMNVFASYTGYDKARFHLAATTPSIIGLWLGNLLLVLVTFGIAQPYAVQRSVRYVCNRLTATGTVDVAGIRQSTAAMDQRGEGLADAFDIDAF